MSNIQAVKLIIENIQFLEQAKELVEGEITERLSLAVDKKIQDYFNVLEIWRGNFSLNEKGQVNFAPENWQAKQGTEFKHQNFYARYDLGCESNLGEKDAYAWWPTTFLKNDRDHIIFSFYPWYDNFKNKVNNKIWKEFTNEINQLKPEIEQAGFKYNPADGRWYLIVEGIELEEFTTNYESNTLEYALTPITDALDKLKQAHPYFDEIVQAAIAKFGRIENEE